MYLYIHKINDILHCEEKLIMWKVSLYKVFVIIQTLWMNERMKFIPIHICESTGKELPGMIITRFTRVKTPWMYAFVTA